MFRDDNGEHEGDDQVRAVDGGFADVLAEAACYGQGVVPQLVEV